LQADFGSGHDFTSAWPSVIARFVMVSHCQNYQICAAQGSRGYVAKLGIA
jgi:hypothetical protein